MNYSNYFPFRSKPIKLSFSKAVEMLKKYDFYDHNRHPKGNGISHKYKEQTIQDNKVVVDDASGLIWQRGGSYESMTFRRAEKWIKDLNRKGFAERRDWRLPTWEEAMSLMEPEEKRGGLHIDPAFDKRQQWIWTADRLAGVRLKLAWVVDFAGGCYVNLIGESLYYVRAVRFGLSFLPR